MARSIWQKTITNETGDIQDGVQITVNVQGGGLATIYDNQSGGTAKANPFLTGANGVAKFFAEPGFYEVTAFKNGETATFEWNNVGDNRLRNDLAEAGSEVQISERTASEISKNMDFNVESLINLLDVPFVDGKFYGNGGFYPDTVVGGGRWKAVASEPHANFTGGTVVTLEALQAWRDAAIAAGGLTKQNLIDTVNVFLDWTGTGTGAFVRIHSIPLAKQEIKATWFGVIETGDSQPALRKAFLTANGGILDVDLSCEVATPLVIDDKVTEVISSTNNSITAIAAMEAVCWFKSPNSSSIVQYNKFKNIGFNANNLANYGLLIDDVVGLYVSTVDLIDVSTSGAVLDGIGVYGPSWIVNIIRVLSQYNSRDGVRCLTGAASEQINSVRILGGFIQSNGGNGITFSGTANSIQYCTIERNTYGVEVNTAINKAGASAEICWKGTISHNYIEVNTEAQIHLKVSSGVIDNLTIQENYLLAAGSEGTGTSLIKVTGGGSALRFKADGNHYYKQGAVVNDIDLDGMASNGTLISDTKDVVNAGRANIAQTGEQFFNLSPIPVDGGVSYSYSAGAESYKSGDYLAASTKIAAFSFLENTENRAVDNFSIYIDTDVTTANVRLTVSIMDESTGTRNTYTFIDKTVTGSSLQSLNLTSLLGSLRRLNKNERVYFRVQVLTFSGGTYFETYPPYARFL